MNDLKILLKQIEQLSPKKRKELMQYVQFLQWQESQSRLTDAQRWSFSFIEAFDKAAVYATENPAGMDVKMAPATVGDEKKPALWAHPPVAGKSVIEYHVPVLRQTSNLRLQLEVGIRDGAKIAKDNLVAFGVIMNGLRVWGTQTNEPVWHSAEIPLNITAGDIVRLEFTTEALSSHEWTWAVWGNPELIGVIN